MICTIYIYIIYLDGSEMNIHIYQNTFTNSIIERIICIYLNPKLLVFHLSFLSRLFIFTYKREKRRKRESKERKIKEKK